jgi:cytochrome P450
MLSIASVPRVRRPTLATAITATEWTGLDRPLLQLSRSWPTRLRPYAEPPPGSGLRPVMGDFGAPVVGHSLEVMADFVDGMRQRYDRLGGVSWSGSPIGPLIAVSSPDGIEQILRNAQKDFANGPAWAELIGPFFDRGLMLLDFEEHLGHRRIMQKAFTRPSLTTYLEMMQPGLDDGIAGWEEQDRFRVLPHIKHLLLASAGDVFLGTHPDGETEAAVFAAFVHAVRAGSAFLRKDVVPYSRWWRGMRGREVLVEYFRSQLEIKKTQATHDDLFAALVHAQDDDGARFTDDDVINHMIFLLMAAHDTSSITLNTMIWGMAANPEWQQAARAEVDAIGSDRLHWDDLGALPTIDLLQQEALRYIAPVPGMMRRAVRDTDLCGFHVPAGADIMVIPTLTHRLPEYWSQPDRFDPTRFLPGGEAERVPTYAYAPFGGGVHKCIGLHFAGVQIKAVLHQMLRRYRWSVPTGYQLKLDSSALPVPRDGLPVRLERRTDAASAWH